jgi:3-hydroxy-9,10-secoandrosta-1,3,5(10)-triene-9,17-dione monooxygenase
MAELGKKKRRALMNLKVVQKNITTISDDLTEVPQLTHAQAVEAAASMIPRLTERAASAEELRRIPQDTIAELHACGLMRLMQPKHYRGSELGLTALMDVVLELAKGCASTAWVYSNLASHSWNIGQLTRQAQDDVWADNPNALVATGLAFPCGKAVPVEGGYKVSGKWPFGSGVNASQWMFVGAMTDRDGGAPERRFFLIPEEGFKSLDNWRAYGLTATGSHDVEVNEIFVPEHRSVSAEVFAAGQNLPGSKLYSNPLYKMPTFAAFAYVLCIVPLGTAKAAVEQFTATMRKRAGTYTGARLAELTPVQARIAEAAACVEFAESVVRRDWMDLEGMVEKEQFPSIETKLRWKRNAAFATQLAVRSVDALMPAAGAAGLSSELPLQRQFRDIHAASSHIGLTWDVHAGAYGQSALGLATQGGMLL